MPGLNLPPNAEQSNKHAYSVADERYAIVRKPDEKGAVVAKFDRSAKRFPKDLHDIDSLIVTYPGSRNALDAATVDDTASLTEEEIDILERAGYPAGDIFR